MSSCIKLLRAELSISLIVIFVSEFQYIVFYDACGGASKCKNGVIRRKASQKNKKPYLTLPDYQTP